MTKEVVVGETYAPVVTIKEFGCFVEILPGKDGMCHISELAGFRVSASRASSKFQLPAAVAFQSKTAAKNLNVQPGGLSETDVQNSFAGK